MLDQPRCRTQVVLHRFAGDFTHGFAVVAHESMQHQSDFEVVRIETGAAQCSVVKFNFFSNFPDTLPQKVGQNIRADPACFFPGLRVARSCDPDRKLFGDRARLCLNRELGTVLAREFHRFATPEFAQVFDLLKHRRLVGRRCVFRAQHKIVRLPAAGNGKPCTTVGQVVDNGPFLGDAGGVVKRAYAAARAHTDILGEPGNGGTGYRRVRVRAAKSVEVAFWRPDRTQSVVVGKTRAFKQRPVFVLPDAIVIPPVIKAEFHAFVAGADRAIRNLGRAFITGNDQLEPARQGVEQLEHRNIKRQAGHGQPGACRIVRNTRIHASEEVGHVAMFNHDPLGAPGRARGKDQISKVGACDCIRGCRGSRCGQAWIIVDLKHLRCGFRQVRRNGLLRDNELGRAVFDIDRNAIFREGRVQRQIRRPRLERAKTGNDQIKRAFTMHTNNVALGDAHIAQHICGLIGTCIELSIS